MASEQARERRKRHRRALGKTLTPAEAALWQRLRNRQLDGRKFRRQYGAGPYILDFYCVEERLAVELDGSAHDDPFRRAYDDAREAALQAHGVKVVRFENREVFENPRLVLEAIALHFGKRKSSS